MDIRKYLKIKEKIFTLKIDDKYWYHQSPENNILINLKTKEKQSNINHLKYKIPLSIQIELLSPYRLVSTDFNYIEYTKGFMMTLNGNPVYAEQALGVTHIWVYKDYDRKNTINSEAFNENSSFFMVNEYNIFNKLITTIVPREHFSNEYNT